MWLFIRVGIKGVVMAEKPQATVNDCMKLWYVIILSLAFDIVILFIGQFYKYDNHKYTNNQ